MSTWVLWLLAAQLSPIFSSTGWFIDSLRIGAAVFQVSTCAFVACELLFTSGSGPGVGFGWAWFGVTAAVAAIIVVRALVVGVRWWCKHGSGRDGRSRKSKTMGERVAEMVSRSNPLYDEGPMRR